MTNIKPEGYRNTADIWEVLFQSKEKHRPVAAKVGAIDYVDDQAVWVLVFPDFPGVKGYMPGAETGVDDRLLTRFIGQDVNVLIKGLDRQNHLVACSRRELIEKARENLPHQVRAGDIIPVTVKAMMLDENRRSSLVVDVGAGYLLEVPRSHAVQHLSVPLRQQYTVGQTVNAKIMQTNPLEVSIRGALPDPWELADFKRGQFISGTVYRVVKGTIFIEPDLFPLMLGLAPVPLQGDITRGDRVSCKVYSFSAEQKKLHLSVIRVDK